MSDKKASEVWRARKETWRQQTYEPFVRKSAERRAQFNTVSGLPLEPIYGPQKAAVERLDDLGMPGEFPYTRGVYPTMYRGREWTRRQIAGFGTAPATNDGTTFCFVKAKQGCRRTSTIPR